MTWRTGFTGALAAAVIVMQEPTPRSLGAPIARFDGDLSAISGVRELPDGRVLLTDFREPALYLVDLRSGTSTRLGRSGSGPNEYREPGGIYAGRGDTSLVLDRAQYRVLLVTRDGRLAGMRAVGVTGSSSSSDQDFDRARLDAAGVPYFADPNSAFGTNRGRALDSIALWRFDPVRQRADTITRLGLRETRILSAEGNMVRSQQVRFSPADAWSVAADGRVAAVRSVRGGRVPAYRVEWIARDGKVVRGPDVQYQPVPVTDADRETANSQRGTAGIGALGGISQSMPAVTPLFADVKPAFNEEDIIISPDGQLWVGRMMPANSTSVTYDVFDGSGARIDRVTFPARSRVVGFGAGAVYVNERDADDLPHLRKYSLTGQRVSGGLW